MAGLEALRGRILRAPPIVVDSALAAAILVAGIIDIAVLTDPSSFEGTPVRFGAVPYILMTAWAGSLALRRKYLPAVVAVSVGAMILDLVFLTVDFLTVANVIAIVVLVFSAAERWPIWPAVGVLLVEAGINAAFVRFIYVKYFDSSAFGQFQPLFYFTILFGIVFFAGRSVRRRRRLADELTRLNDELGEEQARLTQQAVSSERRRIAGELQALVLQRLEDAVRQIEVASDELRSVPLEASETIASVEASGRETVIEMGRMLSLIRATEGESSDREDTVPAGAQP
jgi:signal transduction histidine kinase